ncbi:hypothetical protein [Hyphomonas oceanitis]|uniref:Glycosyltransferase RgtA/B/C/D-like domain-containing protein n=1 Tax=Hyphomonas oceanitis SCH89 TaxID=1280953 RepID=A0A059G259_9PROT|nr:hypothetical protein [Hyphomonas oceanitis]KDA00337.1 hypothetical protein HOC_19456 [Hyphomonas oceanitis SCH89]
MDLWQMALRFSNAWLRKALRDGAILMVCLLAAVTLTVFYGHDANWDLRNYHLYLGYAFLEGHFDNDIAPADFQSLFNPLLDAPYYFTLKHFGLKVASILLSVYFGLYAFVLWKLNRLVFACPVFSSHYANNTSNYMLPLVATVLGLTAAATFSQSATTFNEIQLALLVLMGFVIGLYAVGRGTIKLRYFVVAGLLIGAAGGLKLTAFTYAPAFVIGLVAVYGITLSIRPVAAFSVAWVGGLLLTYGWWAIFLEQRYDSPMFPLYNSIFKSGWYPEINFKDMRFVPNSPAEWVLYPLNWAVRVSGEVSEPLLRDPRLALFLLLGTVLVFFRSRLLLTSRRLRFLVVFAFAAYIIWLIQFSYLRYAVAVEGVATTVIIVAIAAIFMVGERASRDESTVIASILLLIAVQSFTKYPAWGRMPFSQTEIQVNVPSVPDNALVLVIGPPLTYVLPFIDAEDLTFVGITQTTLNARGYKFHQETVDKIRDHDGSIKLLIRGAAFGPELQQEFGVTIVGGTCYPVTTNFEPGALDISMCTGEKIMP